MLKIDIVSKVAGGITDISAMLEIEFLPQVPRKHPIQSGDFGDVGFKCNFRWLWAMLVAVWGCKFWV